MNRQAPEFASLPPSQNRPNYPRKPFETVETARTWTLQFVRWYKHRHKHSALKFVAPAQRHKGKAHAKLKRREQLYETAKLRHPQRWSGETGNWKLRDEVWLVPERMQSEPMRQAA